MLDIKELRDNIDQVQNSLQERGYSLDVKKFKELDAERKVLQVNVILASGSSLPIWALFTSKALPTKMHFDHFGSCPRSPFKVFHNENRVTPPHKSLYTKSLNGDRFSEAYKIDTAIFHLHDQNRLPKSGK